MRRAAAIVWACGGLWAWGATAVPAAVKPKSPPAEALKRQVATYSVRASLVAALADLEGMAGVEILVDWDGLQKAGVTKQTPVALEVEKVTWRQVLDLMLAKASPRGEPLGWRLDQDSVQISTQRRLLLLEESIRKSLSRVQGRPAPQGAAPERPATERPAVERRSVSPLRAVLPSVKFDNLSFRDAMKFFQTTAGTNFHVNWRAIQQEGIDPETPISLDVRGITFTRALDLILDQVSAGKDKFGRVYWTMYGGILMVTTGNDLNREMATRVIDASSALMFAPDFKGPRISLTVANTNAVTGEISSTERGGLFEEEGRTSRSSTTAEEDQPPSEIRKKQQEAIIKAIKGMTGPEMWEPDGKGSISFNNNNLIISQTLLGFKLMERALR